MISFVLPINFKATLIMNSVDKNWFLQEEKNLWNVVERFFENEYMICAKDELYHVTMDYSSIRE